MIKEFFIYLAKQIKKACLAIYNFFTHKKSTRAQKIKQTRNLLMQIATEDKINKSHRLFPVIRPIQTPIKTLIITPFPLSQCSTFRRPLRPKRRKQYKPAALIQDVQCFSP